MILKTGCGGNLALLLLRKRWLCVLGQKQMCQMWAAKIELKKGSKTLLDFKMGWKGIMIRTFFNQKEETYLLKQSGMLNIKFILIDVDKIELMDVESDFQWSKMNYNYNIKTTEKFDQFQQKELLMLTVLHCINYHMTIIAAAS